MKALTLRFVFDVACGVGLAIVGQYHDGARWWPVVMAFLFAYSSGLQLGQRWERYKAEVPTP